MLYVEMYYKTNEIQAYIYTVFDVLESCNKGKCIPKVNLNAGKQ